MDHRQRIFGVEKHEEHAKEEFLRDIRTTGARLAEALYGREAAAVLSGMGAVLMLVVPWTCLLLMPVLVVVHLRRILAARHARMPMRAPETWDGPDFGDVRPDGGFHRARGCFYLGNEMDRNAELWIAKEDALTHTLVLGTTGAGKTETLVSMAFNYLARGSGLLYVDPKAAPRLAVQIYTMCRIMGRDDDFLLLSYMSDKKALESPGTGGQGQPTLRQSNTQNPFAVGTANELTQLLFALMPEEGSGSNAIFSNNAQTLISGLLFALVELRDRGESPLSIDIIRKYLMSLPEIDALARRTDLSDQAGLALKAGLATVGWDISRPLAQQPRNFAEQYGYARAYFGRALSLLVDNYGRIFKTTHGEIDAVDVITSRRIYVTLIPSMDKDPKELKNLGQISLSSIRNACAVGLGGRVQGRVEDVLGSLPTDAKTPFGVVVDEYAAIETPGFEILLTQGRGLGIAVTVASQDFAGIRRASENAAEQIVSNCKVKCFMCTEDPRQTFDLVKALAGEAFVQRTTGWSRPKGNMTAGFVDNSKVSMERLARVDFRDLQKQVEGQMTVFFKGQLIRARSFYASPPVDYGRQVRLNCHLRLQPTSMDVLDELASPVHKLERLLPGLLQPKAGDRKDTPLKELDPELEKVVELWHKVSSIPEQAKQYAALAALIHQAEDDGRKEDSGSADAPDGEEISPARAPSGARPLFSGALDEARGEETFEEDALFAEPAAGDALDEEDGREEEKPSFDWAEEEDWMADGLSEILLQDEWTQEADRKQEPQKAKGRKKAGKKAESAFDGAGEEDGMADWMADILRQDEWRQEADRKQEPQKAKGRKKAGKKAESAFDGSGGEDWMADGLLSEILLQDEWTQEADRKQEPKKAKGRKKKKAGGRKPSSDRQQKAP